MKNWMRTTAAGLGLAVAFAGMSVARAGDAPLTASEGAVAQAADPIAHVGRWMVDAEGRVVVIHGVNVPSKELPAYPAALGFGDDDAALLASAGFNAVRITVERYAAEPTPGHFDDAYVARIGDTVDLLARHHILTLVDFHQDEYGPVFFDNGFPGWMTMTDGLPNVTQVGFPAQYFLNPALNRAFDHFWANDIGPSGRRLQADDARILAHVAGLLRDHSGLVGFEIINEPWPGSQYPACLTPVVGCPHFDRTVMSAYYRRVISAVRAADPTHLIWYEPITTFNQGVPTAVTGPARDRGIGFAFHDYPLCSAVAGAAPPPAPPPVSIESLCTTPNAVEDNVVLTNALSHVKATGDALLETEFGNTTNAPTLLGQLGRYDGSMVPWMFWSYTRFIDPYANDGTLQPAASANAAEVGLLARPYPQLVAGTPRSWSFDPTTRVFSLRYSPARAGGHGAFPPGSETDLAVPAIQYPHGYTARVRGGHVLSDPNAPILRVLADASSGLITVEVTPTAQ